MKRKVDHLKFILVLLILLPVGCDMFTRTDKTEKVSEEKAPDEVSETAKPLAYELASFKKESSLCAKEEGQCAEVTVQYPLYKGESFLNRELQKSIRSSLNEVISDEAAPNVSVEKMAQLVIDDYNDFIEEFSNERETWEINIMVSATFQKGDIISISQKLDSYTGGAHPNSRVDYMVFDLAKKRKLKPSELVTNVAMLEAAAEKIFRKQKGFSKEKNLQEEGYYFEKGQFKLNDNIGISQNGIIVYFNSYEIAPYAVGPSSILVPSYEIKDILKIAL